MTLPPCPSLSLAVEGRALRLGPDDEHRDQDQGRCDDEEDQRDRDIENPLDIIVNVYSPVSETG